MDGSGSPARVAGKVNRTVTLNGKKYLLSQPQKVGDYADTEQFILSRRIDPTVFAIRACRTAPPNQHAAIWEGAMRAAQIGMATPEEWDAYYNSRWPAAFMLFKSLDPKHAEDIPDVEAAMRLLEAETQAVQEEAVAKATIVAQTDALKNSSGPTETSDRADNQQTGTQTSAAGPSSTSSSAPPTDGPAKT